MKAMIDGKEVEGAKVQVVSAEGKELERVIIRQFERNTQGQVDVVEEIFTNVREATGTTPPLPMCADWPMVQQKYNWIWYRGCRWGVRKNRQDVWEVTLPGEECLLEWMDQQKDLLEAARKEWSWSLESQA